MHREIFKSRSRLIRLCRSLSGDSEAAEDLAQETLVEAWRGRGGLRDPDAAQAWLAGIARNVCRRHARRTAMRQTYETHRATEEAQYGRDAWEELERSEQAALLDRAIGLLPETARTVLAAHYWKELPLAEIAAQTGCTENTAAVRLGRARAALRIVLRTRLGTEAEAFGLTEAEDGGWRETRVWCFRCGRQRLEEHREDERGYEVRCSECDGTTGEIAFSTGHADINSAQVLGTVRSCKPALRRINVWWDTRLQRGLREGNLPCWRCSNAMTLLPTPRSGQEEAQFGRRVVFLCGRCHANFSLPASGLAFHSAAVQGFWQQYPRIRVRPEQRIETSRGGLIVTRYEAVGSVAAMEIAYDALTFQQREVRTATL